MAVQWDRMGKTGLIGCGVLAGGILVVTAALVVALVVGVNAIDWDGLHLPVGRTPSQRELDRAVEACDVAAVEGELEKGGRQFDGGHFELFGGNGATLDDALACGPEMATLLARHAVANEGGDDVVHAAVRSGDPALLVAVLDAGANVDARDDAGDTALLDAVTDGEDDLVELLLLAGADPDLANDAGHSPLFRAVAFDRQSMVATLLASGAAPDSAASITSEDVGRLVFLQAAEEVEAGDTIATSDIDFERAIAVLGPSLELPVGATMFGDDTWRIDAMSPLYLAVAVSSDEVVVALLDAGADPSAGVGPNGHRPADAADLLGRTELATRIRATG